jgi:predicted RNase H-like HicB family nuclease
VRNEFTAVVERHGRWHIAYCPEIPGANGQGKTKAAALKNLRDAIALILEDRRKDGYVESPRGQRERRSSSGEAGRPPSPLEKTRLSFETRGAGAFAVDQPHHRSG